MADAGRIGFVLKGNYDNTTQYERLDVVTYNNVLYAAKRDTVGNVPTGQDDDNWKVLVKNQVNGDFATKAEVPTLVKVDGDTITKDADGTLHGSAEIDIDTELSETSTNPLTNAKTTIELGKKAPKEHTHDEFTNINNEISNMKKSYALKEHTHDEFTNINNEISNMKKSYALKSDVPKLVKVDGKTVFLSYDGTLYAKGSGGGATIIPKPVVNPLARAGSKKVTITWEDPADVMLDGIYISKWAGTKLVMKEDDFPISPDDGTLLVDITERDKYKTDGYVATNLTNGTTYYFALFPYSTDEFYNSDEVGRLTGRPMFVKLDACTNVKKKASEGKVVVSWTDPNPTKTVDGVTATWAKTVLVYKEGTEVPISIDDGTVAVEENTINQYSTNGYEVIGLTDGKEYSFSLFTVSTEDVVSEPVSITAKLYTSLTITASSSILYNKSVTASKSADKSVTGTFSSSGSATLKITWNGTTTIKSTDDVGGTTTQITISDYEQTYTVTLDGVKIVTFADGTDKEIAAMMQAHYDNKINITDYWAVGDKRSVNLSAMSATYVGESHRAQTIEFAIADFGKDELSTPINGHTMAAITLTQVNCLMDATSASNSNNGSSDTERGYMNSSDINAGGWKDCARRKWCNEVYYNALPSVFRSMVKEVNKKTSAGNQSSTINTTKDKAFLLSESEIYGSTTYSKAGEGSQYEYYKTTANRYKLPKWSSSSNSHAYWDRSPRGNNSSHFCSVGDDGDAGWNYASGTYGFAPCLCI